MDKQLYIFELRLVTMPSFSQERMADVMGTITLLAHTEEEARVMAADSCGEEGFKPWMNSKASSCTRSPLAPCVMERLTVRTLATIAAGREN